MFNKIKTVGSISDFLGREDLRVVKRSVSRFNKKSSVKGLKASLVTLATGAAAISLTNTMFVSTANAAGPVTEYMKGTAKEKIVEAFMPLVDMIQALSYPIALVMLTGGALMFMINQKDKGIGLIQNASIGYILVQLMPMMMQLLVGIGNTVAFGVPLM